MKTVNVYYSLDGNTKQAAEALAEQTGADICPIEPVKPLVSKGKPSFGNIMKGGGQVTFGICPKLREFPLDLAAYDRIILGTPVWAGKCAAPVYSFVRKHCPKHGLAERVTAAFTLSGSGDNSGCVVQLQKLLPNIRETVSLADGKSPLAQENSTKLARFAKQISE